MEFTDALRLMGIEKECVIRNSTGICKHNCGGCDLVQNDTDLIEAYQMAIFALGHIVVEEKPLRLVTDRAGSAYCPTCGSYKTDYHAKTHSLDDTPQNFCSECGQGLIWDIDWKEA